MTADAPQTNDDGAGNGDGQQQSQSKGLDDYLASLDDEAKAAIRGEIDKARREAAAHRVKARDAATKAAEYDKLVESQKTAEQKAQDEAKAAADKASKAIQRAVGAEIKALAAGKFADPEDASAFLGDLTKYADADGEIDTAAISSDLADLLKRKPHLATPAETRDPRRPAPDRTQGSSGNGGSTKTDARTEFGEFLKAQLQRRGI